MFTSFGALVAANWIWQSCAKKGSVGIRVRCWHDITWERRASRGCASPRLEGDLGLELFGHDVYLRLSAQIAG
jgi:hypothetical protein